MSNETNPGTPERDLAAEVLRAALYEATLDPAKGTANVTRTDVAQARAFCLNEQGPWAESRERWCAAIGLLPELYRRHALRKIGLPEPPRFVNKRYLPLTHGATAENRGAA